MEMRNQLLQKQMAKCSHANHCHVGRRTILLKPQVMVLMEALGLEIH
jgi:hypothetical protein